MDATICRRRAVCPPEPITYLRAKVSSIGPRVTAVGSSSTENDFTLSSDNTGKDHRGHDGTLEVCAGGFLIVEQVDAPPRDSASLRSQIFQRSPGT